MLKEVKKKERIPVTIPIQPHLADHRFEGRAVFPAVEALQLLARAVAERFPHVPVSMSGDARFLRFLPVPDAASSFDALIELEPLEGDSVTARLLTQTKAGGSGMARLLEHTVVTFGPVASDLVGGSSKSVFAPAGLVRHVGKSFSAWPPCFFAAPQGAGLLVPSADLYGAMVPFGPAYHNARDPIVLTPEGASGRVVCPDLPYPHGPLGSPFPLDAAFHIACGWGERHVGSVLFPVGYESRIVVRPTEPGGEYYCRVVPAASPAPLGECVTPLASARFDLWIFDRDAALREACFGVRMVDVSRGRFVPPDWGRWDGNDSLEPLRSDLCGMVVLELASVLLPLALEALTPGERELAAGLGERRRPSFLAARVALKRLARSLGEMGSVDGSELTGNCLGSDDRTLHTVAPDGIRPVCPVPGVASLPFCSVAHDVRFAIAVAADGPVGVDVEPVADKALRGMRLFLSPAETRLVEQDPCGPEHAATRLWTIKEAAAKALSLPLPQAWHAVEALELAGGHTVVRLCGHELVARHTECGGHLFTTLRIQ